MDQGHRWLDLEVFNINRERAPLGGACKPHLEAQRGIALNHSAIQYRTKVKIRRRVGLHENPHCRRSQIFAVEFRLVYATPDWTVEA